MNDLNIATGSYINLWKDSTDIYLIINEPNDVDDDKILCATTYLENTLKGKDLNNVSWNNIKTVLEGIFPYGTHIVKAR